MFTNRKITGITIFVLIAVFALGMWNALAQDDATPPYDVAQMYGMNHQGMQGRGMEPGMMNDLPEYCLQGGFYGMGMMGGMIGQFGRMGMMMDFDSESMGRFGPGNGMMGAWTPPTELTPANETLTLDEAIAIAEAYVAEWESETPLKLGEVMQFDNHFYANAMELESDLEAFEFLVDPQTGTVYGEPGPNMMWNLQYGMSMGRGMGMYLPTTDNIDLNIDSDEAVSRAQEFLNQTFENAIVADDDITTFYGYYTLHILENDEIIGMLSVNGYTGQVWLHHWHGRCRCQVPK